MYQGQVGRLYWRSYLGAPKERRFVRVSGVAPDIDITPFTENLDNLRRAVEERVFQVKGSDGLITPPRPAPGKFASTLSTVRKTLLPLLPKTAPITHASFVHSYEGRKRCRYQEALDRINNGRFDLKRSAEVSVFLKFEKTDRTSKSDPVPRVISPRDPCYNVKLGRYLKKLEKPLFSAIDGLFQERTIMKGLNAEKSANVLREKWESFTDPVAVGLDASRFDQHVSKSALEWEHDIYLQCFPSGKHRRLLKKILDLQLENHCFGTVRDGELRYVVEGTRMSGDMNTSMGNCLLMCSMIWAYLHEFCINAKLANNGDDCVLFLERADLNKLNNLYPWFLDVGFNMAIEKPVDEFEQLEFCQTKPVFDGRVWIMCRKPSALAKDAVLLHPWDDKSQSYFRGWLHSIGIGGLRLAGGLPIFQEFYAMYLRSGKQGRKKYDHLVGYNMKDALKDLKRDYCEISPVCRASFYSAFGITPDEQVCLERFYRSGKIGGGLGSWAPRSIMGSVY